MNESHYVTHSMSDKKCVAHYKDVVVQNYNKYRTLLYYIVKQYLKN